MIYVLHSAIGEKLSSEAWDHCISRMPDPVRVRISRFHRWKDRQAGLFGKLLLVEGLMRYGYPSTRLSDLVWDASGRPFLGFGLDFNISHSGDHVVCALCSQGRVGIDIEEMRPIDISDFKAHMTADQWETVTAAKNRLNAFFTLWTQKEAVIKADGRGLSISLDEIHIKGKKAFLGDDIWRVEAVRIADGYRCHLARSSETQPVHIEKIFLGLDHGSDHTREFFPARQELAIAQTACQASKNSLV